MPLPYSEPKYTPERVAVMLYHAANVQALSAARVLASVWSAKAMAHLEQKVAQPYRAWEAETLECRDYWRAEVKAMDAKLLEEFGECGSGAAPGVTLTVNTV